MNNINNDMQSIAGNLAGMIVDTSLATKQDIDYDIVEWYKRRFAMFQEDGVKAAISCYLRKLQFRKDVNDITKTYILSISQEY